MAKQMTNKTLIRIRKMFGFSQQEFATVLGTKYTTYREWETARDGRSIPATVQKLVCVMIDIAGTEIGEKYGV